MRSEKARAVYDDLVEKLQRAQFVVYSAEDEVFADFCASIGVEDIREYESRQLKVANEELAVRRRFELQIARLKHQWVSHFKSYYPTFPLIYLISIELHLKKIN